MPRRNRVTPSGQIVAVPERGTVMGNRGRLHDEAGRIRRPWQVMRWLLCKLEFNGRRRMVMAPGRYTELFFLDEATGLAAGHRPCFECRRGSFHAFANAWSIGTTGVPGAGRPTASSIDERLHAERVGPGGSKRTFRAVADDLPNGVFVTLDRGEDHPFLIWGGKLLAWSPGGYRRSCPLPIGEEVTVLTPRSTVNAIRAGYVPEVHPSAGDSWTRDCPDDRAGRESGAPAFPPRSGPRFDRDSPFSTSGKVPLRGAAVEQREALQQRHGDHQPGLRLPRP